MNKNETINFIQLKGATAAEGITVNKVSVHKTKMENTTPNACSNNNNKGQETKPCNKLTHKHNTFFYPPTPPLYHQHKTTTNNNKNNRRTTQLSNKIIIFYKPLAEFMLSA